LVVASITELAELDGDEAAISQEKLEGSWRFTLQPRALNCQKLQQNCQKLPNNKKQLLTPRNESDRSMPANSASGRRMREELNASLFRGNLHRSVHLSFLRLES
jgi:hypothetical protein